MRGGIKGILLVFILCSTTLLLAGFRGQVGQESQSVELQRSMPLLTSIGKSVTAPGSPLRLVVKWQGEYNGSGHTAGLAATNLSSELGLGEVSREDGKEHLTYRSTAGSTGFTTTLLWTELGEDSSYVIITLETADLINASDLQAAAEQAGTKLKEAGITAEWNTSLQGVSKEQGDPRQALLLTEKNMKAQLPKLTVQERYEDATTASHSYTTSALQHSVVSGEQKVALQTAIHQVTDKGISRITIGLPLITIEY
ncbi:YwmB family TATA-box binding protein [Paenibacillus wynnii]|uniref:TATA-box binding protein n=1 Tax=Paenibacillus wynnii TaxID=268407 RepID=A0A098MH88_9BACL|nr:YwmB family TATA-box binding protein [Paenibacillus wynnii]KGE20917.1 hypothetical protein PWYN_01690 [Paenibacillus wynnii]